MHTRCEAVEVAGLAGWAAVSSQKIVDTARLQFVLVRERNIVGGCQCSLIDDLTPHCIPCTLYRGTVPTAGTVRTDPVCLRANQQRRRLAAMYMI